MIENVEKMRSLLTDMRGSLSDALVESADIHVIQAWSQDRAHLRELLEETLAALDSEDEVELWLVTFGYVVPGNGMACGVSTPLMYGMIVHKGPLSELTAKWNKDRLAGKLSPSYLWVVNAVPISEEEYDRCKNQCGDLEELHKLKRREHDDPL